MKKGADGFTDGERDLLDALVEYGDLLKACDSLDLDPMTARQRLYRLRKRYQKERRFVEAYGKYRLRIADRKGVYL